MKKVYILQLFTHDWINNQDSQLSSAEADLHDKEAAVCARPS